MNQFTYELFLNVFYTFFADDYLYNLLNYPITRKSAQLYIEFCDYADEHDWDMYMCNLKLPEMTLFQLIEVNLFKL